MVVVASGDLLRAEAEALVNPVNCVGVMGSGLALQFRRQFPRMFAEYVQACRRGEVRIGQMHVFDHGREHAAARWLINFPTKQHWREPSRMSDIEAGLVDLVAVVQAQRMRSLAVPALGCGLGGLPWDDVRPRIELAFAALANVQVLLYPPHTPSSPKH